MTFSPPAWAPRAHSPAHFRHLSRPWRLLLATCWLLLVSSLPSLAGEPCLLVPISLEERTQKSVLVAEGQVIAQEAFWDDAHRNIYTAHTVEVFKLFKGTLQSATVEVITEGGQIGDTRHVFSSALDLQVGQQGVFFLDGNRPGRPGTARYGVYSSQQGFIRYELRGQTAQDPFRTYNSIYAELYGALRQNTGTNYQEVKTNPAVNAAPRPAETTVLGTKAIPVVTNFSPTTTTAGSGTILTINGLNFGATRGQGTVGFRNADDGGKTFVYPVPNEYVSWSDTQIRVRVPSNSTTDGTAGTGQIEVTNNEQSRILSVATLTITYALSNVKHEERTYLPNLVSLDGTGGYTFRFSANFNSNAAAKDAFTRAINTWSCETGINWRIGTPTTVTTSDDDGVNVVRFGQGTDLAAGVLARCISRYNGCSIGGEWNWYVTEMDLEFASPSSSTNWQLGPGNPTTQQYDFESIALHELGHGHQLSHVILPRAVMHYGVGRGQISRRLNPENDIAGAAIVMARSQATYRCRPGNLTGRVISGPIVPSSVTSCRLAADLVSFTAELFPGIGVVLTWATSAERNTQFFIVERSRDGAEWEEISRVAGAGTTTSRRDYQFTDPAPLPGISYYRLRIVDTAGEFGFSQQLRIMDRTTAGLALARNPVYTNQAPAVFYLPSNSADETLSIYLYDNAAQLLLTESFLLSAGFNFLDISLPPTSQGLYHIRWSQGTRTGSTKLLKLR